MPLSKFHNLSNAQLADDYGNLSAQIKTLEAKADELKDELKARDLDAPAIGSRWTVTVSTSETKRLDTKALRELLGDGLTPYEKTSVSTRLLVKPTMVLGEAAA